MSASAGTTPGAPLTVAVTGPTGNVGRSLVRALDACDRVGRIVAMARRPAPAAEAVAKLEYRQGDVCDPRAVAGLVAGADAVVHLAMALSGEQARSPRDNLQGARNVFAAAVHARARTLVHVSSIAVYGAGGDTPLSEDVSPPDDPPHPYARHKGEVERALWQAAEGSATRVYAMRPCIVAGPDVLVVLHNMPYIQLSERTPPDVLALLRDVQVLHPVILDTGVRFQLVHHDDMAAALLAAVLGHGAPGAYNLAGEGVLGIGDLADALGWYAARVPAPAAEAAAGLTARLPLIPAEAQWINSLGEQAILDCSRARRELSWTPDHDGRSTLRQTVDAARLEQIIR